MGARRGLYSKEATTRAAGFSEPKNSYAPVSGRGAPSYAPGSMSSRPCVDTTSCSHHSRIRSGQSPTPEPTPDASALILDNVFGSFAGTILKGTPPDRASGRAAY